MNIYKYLFCIVFLFGTLLEMTAQQSPFVDIHTHSSTKPFNSRSTAGYNIWEYIDHECGDKQDKSGVMKDIGQKLLKNSQSNFESLWNGNTRLISLTISPVESNLVASSVLESEKNKKGTVSCLTGIVANELFLRRKEVDYYNDLVENIRFLERYEGKPYYVNGNKCSYIIVRRKSDIDSVLNNPNLVGILLNIEGGHSLGHSIYINEDITDKEEYQQMVFKNINRLKGIETLTDNSDRKLDVPIFFMSLCKNFNNGFGGQSLSFNRELQSVYGRPDGVGSAPSSLGKEVIDLLISRKGRRILIDVSHMGIEFRKFYYQAVERAGILGENIPIVASHCGISGEDWDKSGLYKRKDDDSKNNNSYLNHWQQNLSKQDILRIYNSRGLIGISLEQPTIAGGLALTEIESTFSRTRQRREACLKVFMANVLTVVKVINKEEAWNIISIGSDFDGMYQPLEPYSSAEELYDLYHDIQHFLEEPTDIGDLFTAEEIEALKFGLKAEEIAQKILSDNAINFIKKNLDGDKMDANSTNNAASNEKR